MFTPFAFVKQAGGGGGATFPLTTAFLTATGITGSANIAALQDFETGIATYSLTSKLTCVYPLIGGTADTTKYNFMNTSLYTLTWSGNLTYYVDGVQSTGYGNGKGETGIAASSLSVSEGHHTVWVNTNESPGTWNGVNYPSEWGCSGDPSNPNLSQYYGNLYAVNGLEVAYPCNSATGAGDGSINYGNSNATGIWTMSRTSASNLFMMRNNSVTQTNTNTLSGRSYSTGLTDLAIMTRGGAYSPRRQGFVTIGVGTGTGLTTTDASNLYTLITAFNSTIGR